MMSTSITNWLQNNHYPSSFRTILLQNKIFITSDFGKLFWTQLFAIINEFKFEHSLQRTRFESDILALYFEFDYPEKYKQSLAKHKQQSSQIKMHYHEEPMKQTNHHIHLPQGMIASHYKRDSFGSLLNLNIEDLSSEEDSVQSSESSVSWPSGVDYDQYKPYKPYKGSTKLHNITMKYVSIYKCKDRELMEYLMSTNVSREEFLDCVEMFGLNKALENLQLNSEISPEMNDMKCQSLL
eukprot:309299_1